MSCLRSPRWRALRSCRSPSRKKCCGTTALRPIACAGTPWRRLQRPGTATGVVFLTLEDELGFVNGVIWSQVYERYQRVARTANLLGVRGRVQSAEGVVHLIAEELYVPAPTLAGYRHVSRDFH
ncbi:MAG: polymerase subunit alpha [Pseudomonadota bacterium]